MAQKLQSRMVWDRESQGVLSTVPITRAHRDELGSSSPWPCWKLKEMGSDSLICLKYSENERRQVSSISFTLRFSFNVGLITKWKTNVVH